MKRVLLIFTFFNCLIYAEVPPLYLLTDDNFPPFSYIEDGKESGFDIDVIRELEKRLGITIVVESLPWAKVLLFTERGAADGAFSLFKTPEREQWGSFSSVPIHYSSYHVFTKIGEEFEYSTPKDLIGKKVGVNRGFNISDEFDELSVNGSIEVVESEDAKVNFFLLKQGRIDCYIANILNAESILNKNEYSKLPNPVVESRGAYLVFSKRSKIENIDEIREKIDIILKEMYSDGTIDKIIQKY